MREVQVQNIEEGVNQFTADLQEIREQVMEPALKMEKVHLILVALELDLDLLRSEEVPATIILPMLWAIQDISEILHKYREEVPMESHNKFRFISNAMITALQGQVNMDPQGPATALRVRTWQCGLCDRKTDMMGFLMCIPCRTIVGRGPGCISCRKAHPATCPDSFLMRVDPGAPLAEPPEILQCGSAKFRFAAGGIKVFITIEQGAVVLERAFLGDPKRPRMTEV